MEWILPDQAVREDSDIGTDVENAAKVVFCCWEAIERHMDEDDVAAAISLLSRLLSSSIGKVDPELELNSRIRLAELCSMYSQLQTVSLEQLSRAVRPFLFPPKSQHRTDAFLAVDFDWLLEIRQFRSYKITGVENESDD